MGRGLAWGWCCTRALHEDRASGKDEGLAQGLPTSTGPCTRMGTCTRRRGHWGKMEPHVLGWGLAQGPCTRTSHKYRASHEDLARGWGLAPRGRGGVGGRWTLPDGSVLGWGLARGLCTSTEPQIRAGPRTRSLHEDGALHEGLAQGQALTHPPYTGHWGFGQARGGHARNTRVQAPPTPRSRVCKGCPQRAWPTSTKMAASPPPPAPHALNKHGRARRPHPRWRRPSAPRRDCPLPTWRRRPRPSVTPLRSDWPRR